LAILNLSVWRTDVPFGSVCLQLAVCPEPPIHCHQWLRAERRGLRLLRRSSLSQVNAAELHFS